MICLDHLWPVTQGVPKSMYLCSFPFSPTSSEVASFLAPPQFVGDCCLVISHDSSSASDLQNTAAGWWERTAPKQPEPAWKGQYLQAPQPAVSVATWDNVYRVWDRNRQVRSGFRECLPLSHPADTPPHSVSWQANRVWKAFSPLWDTLRNDVGENLTVDRCQEWLHRDDDVPLVKTILASRASGQGFSEATSCVSGYGKSLTSVSHREGTQTPLRNPSMCSTSPEDFQNQVGGIWRRQNSSRTDSIWDK